MQVMNDDQFVSSQADRPSLPAVLPPFLRFIIAALWTYGVFWASGFVYALFPKHYLIPDLLYRVVACILTAGGFAVCLRVLDYNLFPLPQALALPLDGTAARQWITGLALGGLLMTADVFCIAAFGSIQFHLHVTRHLLLRASAIAVLLLFGALLEELSFRGYPFQKLTEAVGAFWAVVILSALFGAVHLGNPDSQGWLSWGFFNTLAIGLLFALARIRTGSLWFSFGLHFGWNFFQGSVFGLPVSGLHEFSALITAHVVGSPRLTGGNYGPEASAVCAVILVLALPLLWQVSSAQNIQHRPPSHTSASGI
jgi:uncharacterized protein